MNAERMNTSPARKEVKLMTDHNSTIGKYLCPGCVHGSSPGTCAAFHLDRFDPGGVGCKGHRMGTMVGAAGNWLALGLPAGFNKNLDQETGQRSTRMEIWIHESTPPTFDRFNLAVWALEKDGALFVRAYSPRLNYGRVVVIIGGTIGDVPGAADVAEFADEID